MEYHSRFASSSVCKQAMNVNYEFLLFCIELQLRPTLNEARKVPGTLTNGRITCKLPTIDEGAVVWIE